MTIYFDMDGTIADLYSVQDWLIKLRSENSEPYAKAKPMVNMQELTSICTQLQSYGIRIAVISWLSKQATPRYKRKIRKAKREWLKLNFPIDFDEIHMIQYGYPKRKAAGQAGDILIDDEMHNIQVWCGKRKNDRQAIYCKNNPQIILEELKKILAKVSE